jgi:hypothetical protein
MSGSNQALLFSTLRYLGLITEKDLPTKDLENLVNANEDSWQEIWRAIITKAYVRLFNSELNLERTTTQELTEAFEREGVSSPDTVRKCVTFFTFAAKDAGITLSPHIKPYAGRRQTDRRIRARVEDQKESVADSSIAFTKPNKNSSTDLHLLISKLPDFDREWSEDLKKSWFERFDRLLRLLSDVKNDTEGISSL